MENKYDFLGTDLKDTSILKLSEENNVDEEEENSNLSTIKTRRNKYDFRDDNPTINIYDYIEQSPVTDNKSITPEPDFMTEELALQLAPPPPLQVPTAYCGFPCWSGVLVVDGNGLFGVIQGPVDPAGLKKVVVVL